MGILSRQPSRVRAVKGRLYDLIDRATSENLSAPNFAVNTDVVSCITGAPDPKYAANKACKRIRGRLQTKNPRAQQLSIQLLETCVRLCGEPFHAELARSDLFVELLHIADKSSWSTPPLQAQVLALLQEWAYTLKPAQFSNAYSQLQSYGVTFPPRNGGPRFEPYPGLSPPPPPMAPGTVTGVPAQAHGHGRPHHHTSPAAHAGPPQLLAAGQSASKTKEDMGVAHNTVALLQEMLDGVPADNFAAAKEDYVMDMVLQCREMKDRLARLIGSLTDEALMAEALQLNDDAQAALDRHADMVAVAEGRRRPPPQPPKPAATAAQPRQQEQAATPAKPAAAAAAGAAAAAKAPAPLVDLLSLDWAPSQPAPSGAAPAPPAGGVVDPFAPAAGPSALATNNPFAAPAATALPAVPMPMPVATPPSDNPFLSDTAFAAAAQPQPQPPLQQQQQQQQPATPPRPLPPAAPLPVTAPAGGSASGNPFGSNPFAATPTMAAVGSPAVDAGVDVGASSYLQLQPSPNLSPSRSPLQQSKSFGAASVGQSSPGVGAPPPVYPGAAYQAPGAYSFGAAASVPPVSPGPYGRPLSDAFGDLVSLGPKEEPVPPPPRGTPMRTPSGLSPEPSTASAPAAASPLPPAAEPAVDPNKAALSAFDAFDELVTSRPSLSPRAGGTSA